MSIGQAIVLGIVQGATEFLPVSSSGHLVLAEHFIHVPRQGIAFEVMLHVGTLIAVVAYFRRHIHELLSGVMSTDHKARTTSRRMIAFLIIGSVPAAVVGLAWKDQIESAFNAPKVAAAMLMVTGIWLLAMRFAGGISKSLNVPRSLVIGCAQAIAILPGISRSGSTIATGTLLGIEPNDAAEYSFLLSVPAVGGAALLSLPDAWASGELGLVHIGGGLVAAVTGYLALSIVFASIRRGRFSLFGAYCLAVGAVAYILLGL